MKEGLIRRVGDGLTTEVWHDKWISGTVTMQPQGRLNDTSIHVVADLVDENSGQWNVDLIRDTFIPPDADAILHMPRPWVQSEDFWAWEWERSGIFSVRSAYRGMIDRTTITNDDPCSSAGGTDVWRALWKLNVQPKIRVFWWRVLKNMLPAYGELKRRHVMTEAFCPMCGHDEESLFHVLVNCDHAHLFWEEAEDFFEFKLPRLHPETWSRDLLDSSFMARDKAAVAISVMWSIWANQNKYAHDEVQFQPRRSMEIINELIASLYVPVANGGAAPVRARIKWQPPDTGWIKINTDGAVRQVQRRAGVGVVAREHSGAFLRGRCIKYEAITDPCIIELLACRDAMAMAIEDGYSNVILETDCQTVCTLWKAEENRSVGAHVIREMKLFLRHFQGFILQHVGREANGAAHRCAREALMLDENFIIFDVSPAFLIAALQSDVVPSGD